MATIKRGQCTCTKEGRQIYTFSHEGQMESNMAILAKTSLFCTFLPQARSPKRMGEKLKLGSSTHLLYEAQKPKLLSSADCEVRQEKWSFSCTSEFASTQPKT